MTLLIRQGLQPTPTGPHLGCRFIFQTCIPLHICWGPQQSFLKKHEADAILMLDWDDVVQVGACTHTHLPALYTPSSMYQFCSSACAAKDKQDCLAAYTLSSEQHGWQGDGKPDHSSH